MLEASTSQLSDNSEGIEGSNYAAVADQNKTPVGAFFNPDPKLLACRRRILRIWAQIPMVGRHSYREHSGGLSSVRLRVRHCLDIHEPEHRFHKLQRFPGILDQDSGQAYLQFKRDLVENAGHESAVESV